MDDDEYEPDEHLRYRRYLAELSAAGDDLDLVRRILRDPDAEMAQAAVADHLNRRATALLTDPGFPAWSASLAPVIAGFDFLAVRLREWNLMRSIATNEPWTRRQLFATTTRFQRTAVVILTSRQALTLFAEEGTTRRIRTTAARRLAEQDRLP